MKGTPHSQPLFTVHFTPRHITASSLFYNHATNRISFSSIDTLQLNNLELERLALFNPTSIGSWIKKQYQACGSPQTVHFCLLGPSLEEHIVMSHSPHPHIHQLPLTHSRAKQWKKSYLYTLDHKHYFYVCSIPNALLLQYQMLAISHQLPLSHITTERAALMQCYSYLYGAAYRPAQLAQSMYDRNNRVELLFHREDLDRIARIPSDTELTDSLRLHLLTACGLFAMQGKKE